MHDALRPERMSKVSVTGAKAVMEEVVAVVYDMNLLHVTEYDGSWDGFEPGTPIEGADELSRKLVTVRSLESILDVDEDDAGPTRLVTDEAIETELEEIRQRVNELDDRRDDLQDQLQAVEDQVDAMAPFAALGIDLDLLQGYDSLQVGVGEGDEDAVRAAMDEAEAVDAFELFTADGVVAVFARPADGAPEDALEEAMVGVDFAGIEVPDLEEGPVDVDESTPETYLQALESRRDQLASKLDTVENELADERMEAAGFLLAVEETLAIEVQKHEAPLSFATTEHSFVAEGWLPSERYDEFATRVDEAVDGRIEIQEIERADYSEHGHPTAGEHVGEEPTAAADGGERDAAADGGHAAGGVVTVDDDPPVVLDNPGPLEPLELLVETVGRPSYTEFDPTWLLFLTFPLFFGYMIGDVAYGLGYAAVGYLMITRFDSEGIRKLGGIGVWCGVFTIVFGVLYGEFLGLHAFGELVWPSGHPPLEKGLGAAEFAKAWMIINLLAGIAHVTLGHVLSFAKEYYNHSLSEAVFESGSWLVLMAGVWGWVLTVLPNISPDLFLSTLGPPSPEHHVAIPIGFTGLPDVLATPMLAVIAIGTVMLVIGEGVQAVEILQVLVNVLSYMRLMAVLLAKAGMAFVVNLFVFGLYEGEQGDLHFATFGDPSHGHVIFEGLINMGIGPAVLAVVVLLVGHLIVFALGITSAGLQSLRLEYVEFFGKFYEGEGRTYNPFGYRREYTTED
jgi:V/A-type H+-transporting ATPase subunit I